MRSFSLGILGFFLVSCAAQSSFKAYYDAKSLLERAQKLDPAHPSIPKAQVELEAGRNALNEARYSRASRSFKVVSREAEKIIAQKDPKYRPVYVEPIPQESIEDAVMELERRSTQVQSPEKVLPEEPSLKSDTNKRMQLPAEALARYLAQKKAPVSSASKPAASPRPAEENKNRSVAPPQSKTPPASPQPKTPPILQDSLQASAPIQKPAEDELKPIPFRKTKLDVILTFVPNESGLLAGSRDELDRMSKHLIENPSNTLVFRSALAAGENEGLTNQRFETVKAYLEGKGVPSDQVQLDDERISATTPLFELFLIEH